MNADDRFLKMAGGVETGVAQLQGKLVFTLGAETAVTLKTGRVVRAFLLFLDVDLGMNFKRTHATSPEAHGGKTDATVAA